MRHNTWSEVKSGRALVRWAVNIYQQNTNHGGLRDQDRQVNRHHHQRQHRHQQTLKTCRRVGSPDWPPRLAPIYLYNRRPLPKDFEKALSVSAGSLHTASSQTETQKQYFAPRIVPGQKSEQPLPRSSCPGVRLTHTWIYSVHATGDRWVGRHTGFVLQSGYTAHFFIFLVAGV